MSYKNDMGREDYTYNPDDQTGLFFKVSRKARRAFQMLNPHTLFADKTDIYHIHEPELAEQGIACTVTVHPPIQKFEDIRWKPGYESVGQIDNFPPAGPNYIMEDGRTNPANLRALVLERMISGWQVTSLLRNLLDLPES